MSYNNSLKRNLVLRKILKRTKLNLISKYNKNDCNYNKITINNILFNKKCHSFIQYNDNLTFNNKTEFLNKYYSKEEIYIRLYKILNFYENYSQIFPILFIFSCNKLLFSNIRRKQKFIDTVNKKKYENELYLNNLKNNLNNILNVEPSNILFNDNESFFINSISTISKNFIESPNNSFNLDITNIIDNNTNVSIENILNEMKNNKIKKKNIKKPNNKNKKVIFKNNINNTNKYNISISKTNSNNQKCSSRNFKSNHKKGSFSIYNNYNNIILPKNNKTIININNNYYQYINSKDDKKIFKTINTNQKNLNRKNSNNNNYNISNCNSKNNNSNNNFNFNNKLKNNISQRATAKKIKSKIKLDEEYGNIIHREFSPKTTRNINKLFKSPTKRIILNKQIFSEKPDNIKSYQTIQKFSPNSNKLYNAIFIKNKIKKNNNISKSSLSNNIISVKKIEKKSSKISFSNINSGKKKYYENEKSKFMNIKTPKKNDIKEKNIPWSELKKNYKNNIKNELRNSCDNFVFFKRTQKDFFKDKFGYNKNHKNHNTPIKTNFSEKELSFLISQRSIPSTKNSSSITESKDYNFEYNSSNNNKTLIKVNRQNFLTKNKKKI